MAVAAGSPSIPRLPVGEYVHRLSTGEYERIVATRALEDLHVELLEGLLFDMSPQDEPYSRAIRKLTMLFARRADLLRVQMPLAVAEGWVPEPDVALVEDGPDPGVRPTTALFVAEVAVSSHTRDAGKAFAYAHAGIPVYWIVDLPVGAVRVHTKPGPKGYASIVAKSGEDVLDAGVEGVEPTTVAALLKL